MKKQEVKKTDETAGTLADLYARFGKERIAEIRRQFAPRKISVIEVEGKWAILRPTGMEEFGNYSMMILNPEIGFAKGCSYLLNELWIDGDRELMDDEDYFMAATLQLQHIVELKKSSFCSL
jgi:hypothetical protein